MQLHEFQAVELFRAAGVPVQRGVVIREVAECDAALQNIPLPVVVKAQVHAGGRGKAGGIKLAKTADEARAAVRAILGMTLRTKQTGPAGLKVYRVLITETCTIASELYISILTDRAGRCPALIASRAGGMDIEETAHANPAAILRLALDPVRGISDHECRRVHYFLCPDNRFSLKETTALLKGLYRVYTENDATLVEVNPVAVTPEGKLIAIDGKVALDDNAQFRHPEWAKDEVVEEQDPREREAAKYSLNYIKVGEGSIGCMVNGAGLAMATMDEISLHGARPANFLDVGGSATAENVTAAFKILASDPDVKAILVNIFGGIMKCDVIAAGIIEACKTVHLDLPLVVRLEGTNVKEGRRMIAESGLRCQTAGDLSEAAKLAVAAAGGKS